MEKTRVNQGLLHEILHKDVSAFDINTEITEEDLNKVFRQLEESGKKETYRRAKSLPRNMERAKAQMRSLRKKIRFFFRKPFRTHPR